MTLKKTNLDIFQGSFSETSVNRATVSISGGDATAVAACVNYLQGTASAGQQNDCVNDAQATGGDVVLDEVNITIYQG